MEILDLFSGIGGFRLAGERMGFTTKGYVENDKYARQSYQAMYDTKGEWTKTDITKVTNQEFAELKGEIDLITGGFPCQTFSIAGKRKGFLDETKGTLFFDIARAADATKAPYLLLENVKGLLSHDKGNTFKTILQTLSNLGYTVYWELVNSKNHGVAQNRERVYITAVREQVDINDFNDLIDGYVTNELEIPSKRLKSNFRAYKLGDTFNIDDKILHRGVVKNNYLITFKPDQIIPENSAVKMADILEEKVDKRYFLSAEKTANLSQAIKEKIMLEESNNGDIVDLLPRKHKRYGKRGTVYGVNGVSPTLAASDYKEPRTILVPEIKQIANISKSKSLNGNTREGKVYSKEGIAPTITSNGHVPKVKQIFNIVENGSYGGNTQYGRVYSKDGVSPTLTTSTGGGRVSKFVDNLVIRQLTPLETFRLQSFPDELFNKVKEAGLSNAQMYKQSGNSVTVKAVEHVMKKLKRFEQSDCFYEKVGK